MLSNVINATSTLPHLSSYSYCGKENHIGRSYWEKIVFNVAL